MLPAITLFLALLAPQSAPAVPTDCEALRTAHTPNPDASGHYHLGDGVTPPTVVNRVIAEYSKEARRKKISGAVTVALTIDTHGNPTNVHVACSLADSVAPSLRSAALSLDQQAVDSVKKYQFTPAMFQGTPVPVDIRIRVTFQIH